jgi:D-beta-D-heptose 7-phosphate kinase/D-beta-D-heptose 1-phosphate adenosyltransferase
MMNSAPDIRRLAEVVRTGFAEKRILVVGDVMQDRYLWGDVERISPEAPVPVLRHSRDEIHAGGAGNVALNLAGLGIHVSLAGFVGDDDPRKHLLEILSAAEVDVTGIVTLETWPTITKTRIIAGHQHVLRIDAENLNHVGDEPINELLGRIEKRLGNGIDAIILSDYGKGVLTPSTCRYTIDAGRQHGIPVFVDPKGRDYSRYKDATLLTPNLKELRHAGGVDGADIDAACQAARTVVKDLNLDGLVLTRGGDGMTLITTDAILHSAAATQDVFDVSGAGDTVIAALAAGWIAGLNHRENLHLANLAAGIVVSKVGTVAVEQTALLQALHQDGQLLMNSVYTLDELSKRIDTWRSNGERIVFTNGCFDLVHAGHVQYLQKAACEGNRLIVAINTDASVRALKGESRPVTGQEDRACVVAALAAVDAVILFDEPTPINVIKKLRPDTLVKGGDYTKDQVVGATEVESWGGRVILVPLVEGRSTSELIRKIAG